MRAAPCHMYSGDTVGMTFSLHVGDLSSHSYAALSLSDGCRPLALNAEHPEPETAPKLEP